MHDGLGAGQHDAPAAEENTAARRAVGANEGFRTHVEEIAHGHPTLSDARLERQPDREELLADAGGGNAGNATIRIHAASAAGKRTAAHSRTGLFPERGANLQAMYHGDPTRERAGLRPSVKKRREGSGPLTQEAGHPAGNGRAPGSLDYRLRFSASWMTWSVVVMIRLLAW